MFINQEYYFCPVNLNYYPTTSIHEAFIYYIHEAYNEAQSMIINRGSGILSVDNKIDPGLSEEEMLYVIKQKLINFNHFVLSDYEKNESKKLCKAHDLNGQLELLSAIIGYCFYLQKDNYEDFKSNAIQVIENKNADYAQSNDPFLNFRTSNDLNISLETGIIVRMMDKISRLLNLLHKEADVEDESVNDTIVDLANYSAILFAFNHTIERRLIK